MIDNLVNEKKATQASVTPLVNQLITAVNTATFSIEALGPVSASTSAQQDVADAVAPIISVCLSYPVNYHFFDRESSRTSPPR